MASPWKPHPADPAGDRECQQRTGGRRRLEHADDPGAAAEHLVGERREQRARLREHHRAHVEDEGHPEVGCGAQEAQPVDHAAQPGAGAVLRRRHLRQPQQRVVGGSEGDDVDEVGRSEALGLDQEGTQQRPDGEPEVEGGHVQRARRGDQLLVQQARDHRRASRVVERVEGRLHADQAVEHPDRRVADQRSDQEADRRGPDAGRREQRQGAAVHRVGDGPAVQAEADQGDQGEDAHRADREGRPGQVVDLESDGDGGHLLAELGDRAAQEEPPVRRGDPDRREVDEEPHPAQRSRLSSTGTSLRTEMRCLDRVRDLPSSYT